MITPKSVRLANTLIGFVFVFIMISYTPATSQSKTRTASVDCENSLQDLIIGSSLKSAFKKTLRTKIESEDGTAIRVQLVVSSSNSQKVDSTIGWLIIDTAKQTINDITNDPEEPQLLKFNIVNWKRFISCRGKQSYSPSLSVARP